MTWLRSAIINPAVPGVYENFLLDVRDLMDHRISRGWSFWNGHVWGNTWADRAGAVSDLEADLRGVLLPGMQTKLWKATSYNVVTPGCEQAVWLPIDRFATARNLDLCFSHGDVYDIEVK